MNYDVHYIHSTQLSFINYNKLLVENNEIIIRCTHIN